jgi:serine protease Do
MGRSKSLSGAFFRYFSIGTIAIICIAVGIFIASGLNFTKETVADPPTAGYPVVIDDQGEYSSPFVAVVDRVQDAVVNVTAVQRNPGYAADDFFWRFFNIPREPSMSSGSGFFFRPDGYILTNHHVVRNADQVAVQTSTGYQYEAVIVGSDEQTDLAVLKVEPEAEIAYIPFGNSSKIKVGDWAIAIGNPFPQQGLERTVTVGVISAKGRSNLRFGEGTPRYQDYIQTDASINPGNSGGPLLNLKGEAIGVNSAISSPTGVSVGIGFAIPINLARSIVPDLIATGAVSRGWLGVYLADVNEKMARENGLDKVGGAYLQEVVENSPADIAGLKDGDIVLEFEGEEVKDIDHFSVLVSTAPKDQDLDMKIVRGGDELDLPVKVGNRDEYSQLASSRSSQSLTWQGMELLNYTQHIANRIGADFFPGVYVYRLARGSVAYRAGILPGSIITQVDNKDVKNLTDLEQAVNEYRDIKKPIPLLLVDPSGQIEYKAIKP